MRETIRLTEVHVLAMDLVSAIYPEVPQEDILEAILDTLIDRRYKDHYEEASLRG